MARGNNNGSNSNLNTSVGYELHSLISKNPTRYPVAREDDINFVTQWKYATKSMDIQRTTLMSTM
jgi:hypothetical protein